MDVVAIKNNIFIEKELMDDVMSLDNENLIEENKKLKHEKNHFTLGLQKKSIKGQYLQSELFMNTIIKLDKSSIVYCLQQGPVKRHVR